LLTGANVDEDNVHLWSKIETEPFKALVEGKDGIGIRLSRVRPLRFFRMLAKMAHGLVAAEVGLCNFTPLLPDLILGRTKSFAHVVGGPGRIMEPDHGGLHRMHRYVSVSQVDGRRYHTVNIRLFLPFDPPEYDIIVGECR
jgi:hypothetical protein